MVTVYRDKFINIFNILIRYKCPYVGVYVALIAFELHAIVTAFPHDQITEPMPWRVTLAGIVFFFERAG